MVEGGYGRLFKEKKKIYEKSISKRTHLRCYCDRN